MMSRKMSKDRATPLAWSNQPARRGLMKTPRKFDSDAAHNAAATLPPAIDVNAIDDCTVDGIKQRSTTPTMRGDGRAPERKWEIPTPRTGNSANVDNRTAIWSFHWNKPEIGRANVLPPVPNTHIVCRLLLEKTKK